MEKDLNTRVHRDIFVTEMATQVEEGVRYEILEKGKHSLLLKYRRYPLYKRGYANYEEVNVEVRKWGKYAKIEVYLIRNSWNGSGYFPVCQTRIPFSESLLSTTGNVKDDVLRILKELSIALQDTECENAVHLHFP